MSVLHLGKDAELLGSGRSTTHLSDVLLLCEILWCNTCVETGKITDARRKLQPECFWP